MGKKGHQILKERGSLEKGLSLKEEGDLSQVDHKNIVARWSKENQGCPDFKKIMLLVYILMLFIVNQSNTSTTYSANTARTREKKELRGIDARGTKGQIPCSVLRAPL
jgi:hypothetical protein